MFSGFPDNFRKGDEDILNEFRQKQVNFDMEERRSEINSSRSLFIGALGGLFMAGFVGWLVLSPQGTSTPQEIPVIRQPASPIKMQPTEPGGIDISNQEKTVYDIIEKKLDTNTSETLMPKPEQPNVVAMESLVEEVVANQISTQPESLIKAPEVAVMEKNVITEQSIKLELPAPAAAPVVEAPKPAPVVEKVAPKPVAAVKGSWQIQLMSSPNKIAVEKSWATMSKKHTSLSSQVYEVEVANLGAKGTYYRLKAGNFSNKAEADAFCSKLKSQGATCFTVKK